MKSQQKCDIPHIKNAWFNKNLITNIISMRHDCEVLRHNEFKRRIGVVSAHARQDRQIQALSKWLACYESE
jgi:hypothetical protein